MNNKGFAITTILYGALILFILLFVSLMGILATYKGNLEKLIENTNGARDRVTIKKESLPSTETFETVSKKGLYCDNTNNCQYVASNG